jgi:hypothetical protein
MWKYLPEVPNDNRDVLVAYKYDKLPIQACWDGYQWHGSRIVQDYMKQGCANDSVLIVQNKIYAWCELPKVPEVLN